MYISTIQRCKLYVSSSRKSNIMAGLLDPVNMELVTQVQEYLDDDDVAKLQPKPEPNMEEPIDDRVKEDTDDDAYNDIDRPSISERKPMRVSNIKKSGNSGGNNDSNLSIDDFGDSSESNNEDSTDIESAVDAFTGEDKINPQSDAKRIKKLLNDNSKTEGVTRTQVSGNKKDELWIYYQDTINLNDVMTNTIDKLVSEGYDYLQFNRLARTDNAIVFEINID